MILMEELGMVDAWGAELSTEPVLLGGVCVCVNILPSRNIPLEVTTSIARD